MIPSRLGRHCTRRSPANRHAFRLAAVAGLIASMASAVAAAEDPVGQVSLLIGEARVVHKDGRSEPLKRGTAIAVGDRLETSANGHVHVRFVDNAAVSIRPDSVLEVHAYHYDAAKPGTNEVRLHVEQGTSRSISGRATEIDKNRFRLNTPVAAIGVRGTDFIVQTSDLGMRATVAEGAIAVAALGANCAANGLGPCAGAQTSVLSAEMGRMMVEVLRGEKVARVVPASGNVVVAAAAGSEERLVAQRAAETASRNAGMLAAETFSANDRAAASLVTLAEASEPDLNRPSNTKGALAWGRYSPAEAFNDKLSVPHVVAKQGLKREAVVGDAEYTLFRATDPSNPDGLISPALGSVDFRLSRGQATFESSAGRTEAASIDKGTLTLDFANRTFATALALSSASAGQAELRVSGDVRANGVFVVRDLDPRQYVAGAVSLDGTEAGYLFERGTAGGLFRGKTLWGR